MIRTFKLTNLCLLLMSFTLLAQAQTVETDPDSGLNIAPGWKLVKANCTICHSSSFILGQRGSRETWLSMIRWMQEKQGLWQFDPTTENTILTYLADQYPPGKATRRAALAEEALPPNPYH